MIDTLSNGEYKEKHSRSYRIEKTKTGGISMKKIMAIVAAGLFIVSAGLVLAEGMKGESKPAPATKMDQKVPWLEKMLDNMTKDLNLTAVQRDKIGAIVMDNELQAKEVMDKMREELNTLRLASEQKMKAVLTKEQVTKYDQVTKERAQKAPEAKPIGK
jgi:Spy/CpxP family protein refolding chaperone